MGSALTILLSTTRELNVFAAIVIASHFLFPQANTTHIAYIVGFLVLLLIICNPFPIELNPLNHFSMPVPDIIEIIIFYILMFVMYKQQIISPRQVLIVLGLYTYFVYVALFPRGNAGIDVVAARGFWSRLGC